MGDAPLPPWGRRARWTFKNVGCPLYAVTLLVGWLLRDEIVALAERHPVARTVHLVAVTLVVALCVVTGLAWLAAEVVSGRREADRSRDAGS